MTKTSKVKGNRLSREILGLLAISLAIAFLLFHILRLCSVAAVDGVLFAREIILTEAESSKLDGFVFNLSLTISAVFFVILFLFLLGERLSYIRDIVRGIDALRTGQANHAIPIEGNNELARLAESINYLAATQREIKEKERALAEEKDLFIRTLSHDIRTPLTSIMAYSEFLSANASAAQENKEYIARIQEKAHQIKELTDILLDGGKRNVEYFETAQLLFVQLAAEFEEALEGRFLININLSGCPHFSGDFDVQEMRRIFDNLISNVEKYANPTHPVDLDIRLHNDQLIIRQKNAKHPVPTTQEGYHMGLNSIRRVAHNYAGQVEIQQTDTLYEITITLSEF